MEENKPKDEWSGFKANYTSPLTGTYIIKHPDSEKVYVGSTTDMANRARQHKYELRHKTHPCKGLQELYDSSPNLHINFNPIEDENKDKAKELALDQEQTLIDKYASEGLLLNAALNARNSASGIVFTEEVRRKMSDNKKAFMSDTSVREKLSIQTKELWKDETFRNDMVAKRNTPEHKAFQSEHKKQLWQDPAHREKICKPVEIDGKSYDSLTKASKELSIPLMTLKYRGLSPNFPNYKILTKEEKK